MAVPLRIPVAFEVVFPLGAFALAVDPVNDDEKVKAGAGDPQERDRDAGERLWAVRLVDADPSGRTSELKVKVAASVAPVMPDPLPGIPFRPVELDGLTITPYVNSNRAFPRVAFSLRVRVMRPVGGSRSGSRVSGTAA